MKALRSLLLLLMASFASQILCTNEPLAIDQVQTAIVGNASNDSGVSGINFQ